MKINSLQGCIPSGGSGEKPFPRPLQLPEAAHRPWAVDPLISKASTVAQADPFLWSYLPLARAGDTSQVLGTNVIQLGTPQDLG